MRRWFPWPAKEACVHAEGHVHRSLFASVMHFCARPKVQVCKRPRCLMDSEAAGIHQYDERVNPREQGHGLRKISGDGHF